MFSFRELKDILKKNGKIYMDELSGDISTDEASLLSPLEVRVPVIGVYTGKGASHSWLWAIETFERYGLDLLLPFNEEEVNLISSFDFLFVAGGDTFALAEGLGRKGAEIIKSFVKDGGIYIGSCAGAYLILYTSKPPLNLFNFVPLQIANFENELPPVKRMKEKAYNRYGCCFIIHPVRDEVIIETSPFPPIYIQEKIRAPLFGGPVFKEPERKGRVLARFLGFTERTIFLYDREVAERMVPGRPAIVEWVYGKGCFYLLGPHLEHPSFRKANEVLLRILLFNAGKKRRFLKEVPLFHGGKPSAVPGKIKKIVSKMMMRALSISDMKAFWKIGEKYYMPEHIPVFIRALHKRLMRKELLVEDGEMEFLEEKLRNAEEIIENLNPSTPEERVEKLINDLKESLRTFLRAYFRRSEDEALQPASLS